MSWANAVESSETSLSHVCFALQFPKKYFASAAKKRSKIFLNRLKWKDNRKLLVDTNIGPGQEFIFDAQEVPDISLWAKSLTEE